MSTSKKLLNYRSFTTVSKYGSLLSRLFFGAIVLLEILLGQSVSFSSSEFVIAIVLFFILAALSISQLLNIGNINRKGMLPGLIDDSLILIFFIFIAPFSPWYSMIWLLAVIRSDYVYGTKGAFITTGLGVASIFLKGFIATEFTSLIFEPLLFQSLALVAVSIAVTTMRTTTDKERKVLMVSMDKAQLERQRLVSLVNSMNDAVIALDSSGEINMYNGSALALLDTNSTLDDQNICDVADIFDENGDKVDILKIVEEKDSTVDRRDLRLIFGENDQVNLRVTISPIKLSFRSSSDRGYILTMRDITKEKSLEDERNEFISVVSHELRTPITVTEGEISNAIFMNEKGTKDQTVQASLESAHKQILFLANMVNDLATLSRAEREDLSVEVEEINVAELMKEVKRNYEVDATNKGLWLETEVHGEIKTLHSNKLYVGEIIQNFVTNSIKYTKTGGITVVASPEKDAVRFDVSDTGIGISKADQKKLFEKFFRSEDFRTRESGGTGLGLYVTQKLTSKIGATIDVSSELNKGSTFSLTVPYSIHSDESPLTEAKEELFH